MTEPIPTSGGAIPGGEASLRPASDRQEGRKALWQQRRRRVATGANVCMAITLAAVLTGLLNYGAYRHFAERWDISSLQYYVLSEKTLNMLDGIHGTVRFITVFQADMPLGDEVRHLLEEYVQVARRIDGLDISVEAVDPDRDLARARELTALYDLTEANVVVVTMDGRHKIVPEQELVDYERLIDSSQLASTGRVNVEKKKRGFQGEQVISSAIQGLAQERRPVVYVLTGHGERNIEEFSSPAGYATVARILRRDNLEVKALLLAEVGAVPEDCSTLIVAGPEMQLADSEATRIGEYLDRSGRLLVLADPGTTTGLERLLETWGVRLARDVVVGLTMTGRELFIRDYGAHPITKPLGGMVTMFYQPRSVEPLVEAEAGAAADKLPADRPRVTSLAMTKEGWAEFNFNQNPARFDADADRAAPVSVAVAVERGAGEGIQLELQPTRIVVVGDSDFVSNGALAGGVGGNVDFLMNAVNWLIAREELLAIGAKAPIDLRLDMDDKQARVAFLLMVGGLPLVVAAFGAGVWFTRRR